MSPDFSSTVQETSWEPLNNRNENFLLQDAIGISSESVFVRFLIALSYNSAIPAKCRLLPVEEYLYISLLMYKYCVSCDVIAPNTRKEEVINFSTVCFLYI